MNRLNPVIWALIAIPGWQLVVMLFAVLGPEANFGWRVLAGALVATGAVLWLDYRVGPTDGRPRLAPGGWIQIPLAMIGSLGVVILASEIGNIALSMGDLPEPASEALVGATMSPLLSVVLSGLVFPITQVLLVHSVVQRSCQVRFGRRVELCIAVAVYAALVTGSGRQLPQVAMLLAFPGWLFARSNSILLSLAGYVPGMSLPLLRYVGISFGIEGFDVVSDTRVLYQPIWFTLIGAALVVVGVGPLLSIFEREAKA